MAAGAAVAARGDRSQLRRALTAGCRRLLLVNQAVTYEASCVQQSLRPNTATAGALCGLHAGNAVGDRWWADETYVKVAGHWRYAYRAIDQFGQVIDVYVSARSRTWPARSSCTTATAPTTRPSSAS
jgi:hypothetical protein